MNEYIVRFLDMLRVCLEPAIPTMSDEWQAATKDYRKYQKVSNGIYCSIT